MATPIKKKQPIIKPPKMQVLAVKGWPKSLNQLVNANQLEDDELAESINNAFSQYGVLSKRKGSSLIVNLTNSPVQGMGVYNHRNNDGSITKYFCAVANGNFYTIDPISKTKSLIAGATFNTSNRVVLVQVMNNLYIFDGVSNITKWDGASFTTNTPILAPTVPTIAKTGAGTGSTTFYYIVTAVNGSGETLGTSEVHQASMPAQLNSTTYLTFGWTAAAGATAYNVYRSTISGANATYLTTVSGVSFVDQGQADSTQSLLTLVPTENTTGGPIFFTGEAYHNAIMGVEVNDKSKVWFSAGGDKVDSFSPGDGGGWYRFHPETGEAVNGLKVFAGLGKDYCYIFQDHKIGQFAFGTTGQPQVSDVNLSVGASSDASIVPFENDLGMMSRYGIYTLRMEPNFVNVLRVSELSIRVHPTYINPITQSAINKVCGVYNKANHVMLWSIPSGATVNNTSLAFDPAYQGFSEYRGIAARAFCNFVDNNNNENTYIGDGSGNILQMFSGTSDNGLNVYFKASTKAFDMSAPYAYKHFKRIFFILGNLNVANLSITLVQDGSVLLVQKTITSPSGKTGWDVDFWDNQFWDATSGTPIVINTNFVQKYYDINKDLFSLQTIYEDNELASNFDILGQYILWHTSNRQPPSTQRL
jgi:hypothetical protein